MLPFSFNLSWGSCDDKVTCTKGDRVLTFESDSYFIVFSGHIAACHDPIKRITESYALLKNNNNFDPGYGQYLAVLIDYDNKVVCLISDPSGIRSLYFRRLSNNGLAVSTLVKNLYDAREESRVKQDECHLLRYGYLPKGHTIYSYVEEVYPGGYKIYSPLDNKENERIEYPDSESFSYNKLYDVLATSLKCQLDTFSHAGVFLGGFDSALVASLLKRQGCDVTTYSFRYEQSAYNQPLVDDLARWLGIEHKWVDVGSKDILLGLKSYSSYCSVPTIWPGYVIQTKMICDQLRNDGVDVCFTGDGCDAAFMGYPSTYRRGGFYKSFPMMNDKIVVFLVSIFSQLRTEYIFGHLHRVLFALLRASVFPVDDRPFRSFQIFDPTSYKSLTGEPGDYEKSDKLIADANLNCRGFSFERKIYQAKTLFSPNRAKLMASIEVAGVPVYSPYMHPMLKKFALTIPDDQLRPSGETKTKEGKQILMQMADDMGLLPKEIIYQPKLAAIKSPIDSWIALEIKDDVKGICKHLPFNVNGRYLDSLCDDLLFEKIYKKHFSDDDVVSLAISLLATYASFYQDS